MDSQGARRGIVSDHRLDVGRSLDADARPRLQQANGVGEQFPRLDQVMLAGGGKVGRAGEGEDAAPAHPVDQHRRAHHLARAERPVGVVPQGVGQRGAMGIEQLADHGGGGRLIDRRRSADQERPIREEAGGEVVSGPRFPSKPDSVVGAVEAAFHARPDQSKWAA